MLSISGFDVDRAQKGGINNHRRPDIQSLRGLAVIAVIAYHAGIPALGGYLGVDMFFAISGFVITQVLLREISESGTISLPRFYLRRIKRLSAPLFVMIAFVMGIAYLFMSPAGAQKIASETAIGVIGLRANYVIASMEGGYFDAASQWNPLLHTWSLAVEEQFYLVFPLGFLALVNLSGRLGKARLLVLVLHALTLIGLMYYLARSLGLGDLAPTSYYSPINRAWEFLVGGAAAFHVLRASERERAWLGAARCLLLTVLVLFLSQKPGTVADIWTSQVAVVFATSALMSLKPSSTQRQISETGSRLFAKVGDWSYSLYLWHWPLIVLFSLVFGEALVVKTLGAIVGCGIGIAAHFMVDKRMSARAIAPLRYWAIGTAAITFIACAAVFAVNSYDMRQDINSKWASGDLYKYSEQHYFQCGISGLPTCMQSKTGPSATVIVVGDSHAQQLFLGLAKAFPDKNIQVWATSWPDSKNPDFPKLMKYLDENPRITSIIFSARWIEKLGSDYGPNWEKRLTITANKLLGGARSLKLVQDIPNFSFTASDCLVKPIIGIQKCSGPQLDGDADYMTLFRSLEQANERVEVIETHRLFCKDSVNCTMKPAGIPLYSDSHHLTPVGAYYLARSLFTRLD